MSKTFTEEIYALVRRIPSGRVMTYGSVAEALGRPRAGRAVGTAMARCGEASKPVPWYRVMGAGGKPSAGGDSRRPQKQRQLLRAEGIVFDRAGACDLEIYEWIPPSLKRRVLEGKSLASAEITPE
jgi:methylated-DNA-protein-cysteine methyltransferase-like protein